MFVPLRKAIVGSTLIVLKKQFGKLSIKRIWNKEVSVIRRYVVYVNGMKISMLEDNIEDSPYLFEEVIKKIREQLSCVD